MAAMSRRLMYLNVVVFLFSVAVSSPVPVLIWSHQSLPSLGAPAIAGDTEPFTEFRSQVIDKLLDHTPHTLVIFVFDKLSIDDFTVFGSSLDDSAFSNLEKNLESATSSYVFPSVNMAYNNMINIIKEKVKGNVIEIKPKDVMNMLLDEHSLKSGENNLLICHMNPVKNARTDHLKSIFSRNDQLIADLSEKISKVTPDFTMLLTAQESSEIVFEKQKEAVMEDHHKRVGRHLLESDEADNDTNIMRSSGTLFNGKDCIYFYLKGMNIEFNNKTIDAMKLNMSFATDAVCNDSFSSASLGVTMNSKEVQADLFFLFNKTAFNWYCNELAMNITVNGSSNSGTYDCSEIKAIPDYSYHCTPPLIMENKANTSVGALQFSEIQVQAFGLRKGLFSAAQDCVGFFTLPIWMGIFSVSILVTILLGGVTAMMSIQTMDRFDDPKGPAINMASEH